ncbi:virulence-associated protein [Comamonas piscis]|uniref:Virulence-associated protein n=1 Tax=Comamonas piscis TaxID=1562974 RepID=A0A7G5ELZ6_9BURK|nr:virulence-associated protein [Comamonas piscis]QMV75021.1 virulence-associated protein [Comamonas piscis]WSO33501.1 virulence-associated protein [Comamonas piscis]
MSYNVLTQAINPPATGQYAGANLFFAKKGEAVLISIGQADEKGLPKNEMATVRLEPAQINTAGATNVIWPTPVLLQAGLPYALSISAADTDTAPYVAQVGEVNQAGGYVTQPPAEIGALSHTNESGVVTKYLNRFLRFELLAVQYQQTAQTFVVGQQAVVNATNLTVNAGAIQPAPDARVTYQLKLLDDQGALKATHDVDVAQPIQLAAPHTGGVQVEATLRRAANGLAPVLEQGTVLVVGSLLADGSYITPAVQLAGGNAITVIFEASLPAGSSVQVSCSTDDGATWLDVPFDSSSAQTAGDVELTHKRAGLAGAALRLRLRLLGNTNARPKVRNLRAVIL